MASAAEAKEVVTTEEEEEIAAFDKQHYPEGPNADFLRVAADGVPIVAKFAGEKGESGGKFEDPERRDIARAVPAIVEFLREKTPIAADGVVLDIGSGFDTLTYGFYILFFTMFESTLFNQPEQVDTILEMGGIV
jgi:hypothetical protein